MQSIKPTDMITRAIKTDIKQQICQGNKAIVIYGARQVGKTTLVNEILSELDYKVLKISGDELTSDIDLLTSRDTTKLDQLISGYQLLFIDEAQRIPDIGINLKIIIDHNPELKVIITGSSALELANTVNEPLTGRLNIFKLFPISILELKEHHPTNKLFKQIEERLIFGSYPELFHLKNNTSKRKFLELITNSYLYKDILDLTNIKHDQKLKKLLQLLAFQIGQEVSLTELGTQLNIAKQTVHSYIDLLEKAFIIFRLSGFSRNLRKEVSKMDKIYFYDLGIRNTIINNLNPPDLRNDIGQIWENFLISERFKSNTYQNQFRTPYFWRTYTGAELDYIEEKDGKLEGFEIKYGNKKAKPPKTWLQEYDNSSFELINSDNWLEWLTD